ncbi:MAG: hypothetical protein HFH68_08645 [Lachnospiraceae bacterium]|nr:hypothetical protein [Lachnospiraceae bacterium]
MYEKAFHGKISCLITYGEANDSEYNPLLKENQKEYIYHSELVLSNQRIIMSDHVDIEFQTCYSNFLTIMFDTKEEVQQAYEIMQTELPKKEKAEPKKQRARQRKKVAI